MSFHYVWNPFSETPSRRIIKYLGHGGNCQTEKRLSPPPHVTKEMQSHCKCLLKLGNWPDQEGNLLFFRIWYFLWYVFKRNSCTSPYSLRSVSNQDLGATLFIFLRRNEPSNPVFVRLSLILCLKSKTFVWLFTLTPPTPLMDWSKVRPRTFSVAATSNRLIHLLAKVI